MTTQTTKATAQDIVDLIESIEADYDVEVEVTGGGRGWTATATDEDGDTFTGKDTSKVGALQTLVAILTEGVEEEDEDEADEDECSEECRKATSRYCSCKCAGVHHRGANPVWVGPKPCKCGCGETTKREFVAGHDARYHAAQALAAEAKRRGLTVEQTKAALKVEANARKAEKARARRAAKKAVAA